MRFASKITGRVELDETTTVEIRALSNKKLARANASARGEGLASAKQAGAELVKAFHELSRAEKAGEITSDVKRKARYAQYDRDLVLLDGITRIHGPAGEIKAEDAIEEMLEEDAQKIHEAILDLSLPALESGPKDSAPSIAS